MKVELELVIQQYEKAKVVQDEQLERLTQICQEQGVTWAQCVLFGSVQGSGCWVPQATGALRSEVGSGVHLEGPARLTRPQRQAQVLFTGPWHPLSSPASTSRAGSSALVLWAWCLTQVEVHLLGGWAAHSRATDTPECQQCFALQGLQ